MFCKPSRLRRAIFFVPLTILICERLSGLAIYQQYYYLSSIENLELYSFIAPVTESNSTSKSDFRKGRNAVENERERLTRIESGDERRTAADGVDSQTEVTIAQSMSALSQRRSPQHRIPLEELAGTNEKHICEKGFMAVEDKHLAYESTFSGNLRIPRIVHQTSRSRCLTSRVFGVVKSWDLGQDWAYYFHSDEAMDRLFKQDWPEFPHLRMLLKCIDGSGTLKADLWRYLVLWEYGGVYADVDTKPQKLNSTTFTAKDDGLFTVEQYHLLSQYFMATSPRHPIMYYTIHTVLAELLDAKDVGYILAPQVTGPHALNRGFQLFMKDNGIGVPDVGKNKKPAKAGMWIGTNNRSITVKGRGEDENEYVIREYIRRVRKIAEYEAMNMTHFTTELKKGQKSCLRTMWDAQQSSLEALANTPSMH